ncbi:unnamed protein product [Mytilus coruscus]|uniref:Uncharacterized protein n=1 Tax=Mytilus coruscus TaxID=42192 RepID=A0A6J8E8W0_MYTCO|nr:unnamed protein product [Mytilus coruscus]
MHMKCIPDIKNNTDVNEFRDIILHPVYGVCVHVVKVPGYNRLLVYDNHELSIKAKIVQGLFKTMTSEWDRNCLKFMLSITFKQSDVKKLGIDVNHTANQKMIDRIKNVIEEVQNVDLAVEDLLNLHLRTKESKLVEIIDTLKTLCQSLAYQMLEHKNELIKLSQRKIMSKM